MSNDLDVPLIFSGKLCKAILGRTSCYTTTFMLLEFIANVIYIQGEHISETINILLGITE